MSITAPGGWRKCNKRLKLPPAFGDNKNGSEVYNALVDPRPGVEIALHTGTTKRTVNQAISDYNRNAVKARREADLCEIETPGKGGRRRGYLSLAEEKKFLNQFKDTNDNRPVLLMAQDEGRFGLWSQVMKAWCPNGYRPLVAKQGVRDYVYAYAAVAPKLGKMTALVLPLRKSSIPYGRVSTFSTRFPNSLNP